MRDAWWVMPCRMDASRSWISGDAFVHAAICRLTLHLFCESVSPFINLIARLTLRVATRYHADHVHNRNSLRPGRGIAVWRHSRHCK